MKRTITKLKKYKEIKKQLTTKCEYSKLSLKLNLQKTDEVEIKTDRALTESLSG